MLTMAMHCQMAFPATARFTKEDDQVRQVIPDSGRAQIDVVSGILEHWQS